MNAALLDSDVKINISLDEIIHLTRGDLTDRMRSRSARQFKNKKIDKKTGDMSGREHSVPLLTSSHGVDIYVSKRSPLLNVENKKRVAQMISSRALNSEVIEKSTKLIPAEYKLVKTAYGLERVLVPSANYVLRQKRNLFLPRKLNKETLLNNAQSNDSPPPLIAALKYGEPDKLHDSMEMEVDSLEDDIIVLDAMDHGSSRGK